jgi:hypothetical protein
LFIASVGFLIVFPLYCQAQLQQGNKCFDNGDYSYVEMKYAEVFKTATKKEKQTVEVKLMRSKNCMVWLRTANSQFNNKKYKEAKENYCLFDRISNG